MKIYVFLLCHLLATALCGQELAIELESVQTEDGYALVGENNEYAPVSVILKLELTNMKIVGDKREVYILPARSKDVVLLKLEVANRKKRFSYSLQSQANYGDITLQDYDTSYLYHLPFERGQTIQIHQGYNGRFSHHNEYALDFSMKIGTPVLAARDGTVIKVVENNNKGCKQESCKAYSNYILIHHADGTIAAYSHLKYKGALVEVGDEVKASDPIGYSGNTGWSTGPHLHFEVFLQRLDGKETLKTNFLINAEDTAFLREKASYRRDY